jgi:hypothetical protein
VVDLKSVFTMNEAAAFIWEEIDGTQTVGQIQEKLAEVFDVAAPQARSDVSEIVSQFEALTLIHKM